MAQSVKCPTLDFRTGHDLRVVGRGPVLGSVLSGESARNYGGMERLRFFILYEADVATLLSHSILIF